MLTCHSNVFYLLNLATLLVCYFLLFIIWLAIGVRVPVNYLVSGLMVLISQSDTFLHSKGVGSRWGKINVRLELFFFFLHLPCTR